MSIVDNKFANICPRTVVNSIKSEVTRTEALLKDKLANAKHISVTADIWSDRKMRGYMGITVHGISDNNGLCLM